MRTTFSDDKEILARYRSRYRGQDWMFYFLDRLLGLFVRSRKSSVTKTPQRILVANAGHLGDVIISTAVLPVLKDAFPNAKIDFITGTHSRDAIEGHPLLNHIIFFDHWRTTRVKQSFFGKIARYYARLPSITRALSAERYDIALDLRSWHPNYILLFWLAGIPVRAGYGRVGYGPTLTHRVAFKYDRRHEKEHQLDVLRELGVSEKSIALAKPCLGLIPAEAQSRADILTGFTHQTARYHVLHPISSTPKRDWTLEGWIQLAQRLVRSGITPVITGSGERGAALAQAICEGEPKAISIVNKTSWVELIAVLKRAEVVYSVETSIGHVARALGRPVVAIYGGMGDPLHWSPLGSTVATHAVPCSPCYNKNGCPSRDCLTRLTVEEVELAAQKALSSG